MEAAAALISASVLGRYLPQESLIRETSGGGSSLGPRRPTGKQTLAVATGGPTGGSALISGTKRSPR